MRTTAPKKIVWTNIAFLVLLVILMSTVINTASAKSLYVIADINGRPTPVQAYNIAIDGTLSFQVERSIPRYGWGAVGMAIDGDSKTLFVTYEESNRIQLINATTMADIGGTLAPGANNLAGIVYDLKKKLLYCVDRRTENLYVYNWDPNAITLTPVSGSPFTLTGAYAYGIALDMTNDLLYVANNSNKVRVYNTSDWSLARNISLSRMAVSIAVDVSRGFLYSGGGYVADDDFVTLYNPYLTQYNLATGTETAVQVEPNGGVIGLGIDTITGFIYITTGRNNYIGGDNLKVYGTALSLIGVVSIGGNPTGLVIPRREVGYNPLNFSKDIDWSSMEEVGSVPVGGTIVYNICFENITGVYTLENVSIIENLPDEVSFITADGDGDFGQYDSDTHTYVWSYPSLPPDSPAACLQLVAQVKQNVIPGTVINNSATIVSDDTGPITASVDVVTTGKAVSYNPLNLSKGIIRGIVDETEVNQVKNVGAGDTIVYGICFDNVGNDYTVNNVSILDVLPNEVSFIRADGDGVFGQYDPLTHTYTWSYSSLEPGFKGDCLELEVQVNSDVAPDTTITNSVVIDSDETSTATASVDVFTGAISYNPLNISKEVIGGTFEQNSSSKITYVEIGDTIIYGVRFDNKDNDNSVTGIYIIDTLPQEVSFVMADGDGGFGQYDPLTHTYTWSYPTLPGTFEGTCLELVVQVNEGTAPGTTITNFVAIDSKETEPATASVDVVTVSYNPLNLSKSIIEGTIEQTDTKEVGHVEIGNNIVYSICFDNKDNNYAVNNVSIVDILPEEISFVRADGDGIFGQYDPITHTYTWFYSSLSPGFPGACLTLTAQVNKDTASGMTITNSVTIDSDETGSATASVNVITRARSPLAAGLSIRPNMIRRNGCCESILAIVALPQGVGRDDIGDEALILNPGSIEASYQLVYDTDDSVEIHAWFDADELRNAVPGYGEVRVQVVGELKSGQIFSGESIIYITKFVGN
jgi:uncharacterized repeat protein (TIGR01451 family)